MSRAELEREIALMEQGIERLNSELADYRENLRDQILKLQKLDRAARNEKRKERLLIIHKQRAAGMKYREIAARNRISIVRAVQLAKQANAWQRAGILK